MECNPQGPGEPGSRFRTTCKRMREALVFFEANLREPKLNCLETWGDRNDLRRMRAVTTLGLTVSSGSVLYGDPNPLETPDHLHDWYDFWDVSLGRPRSNLIQRRDGGFQREFAGGTVIYNEFKNGAITVKFDSPRKRGSTARVGTSFELQDADGDIFVLPEQD